ncbi:hypothetical protein MHYP_G00283320, partial [Metynnis hypsauchen]
RKAPWEPPAVTSADPTFLPAFFAPEATESEQGAFCAFCLLQPLKAFLCSMVGRQGKRMDEGLMMMQELEDRLKEQIDKLEHIRLAATDLRENLTGNSGDLRHSIAEHIDWLGQLTERVETLQMNTSVFVQMNAKPRTWRGKQQSFRSSARWGRGQVANDAQSEFGWSPVRTRRNSDAASEMSCAW